MAREEKVWEYAMDAGFTPLEDRCIIVKGAAHATVEFSQEKLLAAIADWLDENLEADVRERAYPTSFRVLLGNAGTGCLARDPLCGHRVREAH